jgi:hypothetical protein
VFGDARLRVLPDDERGFAVEDHFRRCAESRRGGSVLGAGIPW